MGRDNFQAKSKDSLRSQIMTPKEAAQYLGLHLITVYRLVKKGKLPGFKIGGQWRFKKDFLDGWIEQKIEHYHQQKNDDSKGK